MAESRRRAYDDLESSQISDDHRNRKPIGDDSDDDSDSDDAPADLLGMSLSEIARAQLAQVKKAVDRPQTALGSPVVRPEADAGVASAPAKKRSRKKAPPATKITGAMIAQQVQDSELFGAGSVFGVHEEEVRTAVGKALDGALFSVLAGPNPAPDVVAAKDAARKNIEACMRLIHEFMNKIVVTIREAPEHSLRRALDPLAVASTYDTVAYNYHVAAGTTCAVHHGVAACCVLNATKSPAKGRKTTMKLALAADTFALFSALRLLATWADYLESLVDAYLATKPTAADTAVPAKARMATLRAGLDHGSPADVFVRCVKTVHAAVLAE
jgi:hypothetical protein